MRSKIPRLGPDTTEIWKEEIEVLTGALGEMVVTQEVTGAVVHVAHEGVATVSAPVSAAVLETALVVRREAGEAVPATILVVRPGLTKTVVVPVETVAVTVSVLPRGSENVGNLVPLVMLGLGPVPSEELAAIAAVGARRPRERSRKSRITCKNERKRLPSMVTIFSCAQRLRVGPKVGLEGGTWKERKMKCGQVEGEE